MSGRSRLPPTLGRQERRRRAVGLDDDLLVEVLAPLSERDAAHVEEVEEKEEPDGKERGGHEVRRRVRFQLLDRNAHIVPCLLPVAMSVSMYVCMYV